MIPELTMASKVVLTTNLEAARKRIAEAVQQAYCLVVTVSEKDEAQAFKVTVGSEPLFMTIKDDPRARIQATAISADAVLPGGPYDLWRKGETTRRVRDLVGAFAQFPHLPKMLNAGAILETLVSGCVDGLFVLRLMRPDRSLRTFWRESPDEAAMKDPGLEVVLPEAAELASLAPSLLVPTVLSSLWAGPEVTVEAVRAYFAGGRVVQVQKEGYQEPRAIPRADPSVVDAAIGAAVREGQLWLTSGPASILGEEIPGGLLTGDASLQAPPPPIPPIDLVSAMLPEAWQGGGTTALALSVVLSKRAGKTLPWTTIREAIDGALRARVLELTADSGTWPCGFAGAQTIRLREPAEAPPSPTPSPAGRLIAEAELRPNEIQDLADQIGEVVKAAAGLELLVRVRIELGGAERPSPQATEKINEILRAIRDEFQLG